jgi:hypothetical protein
MVAFVIVYKIEGLPKALDYYIQKSVSVIDGQFLYAYIEEFKEKIANRALLKAFIEENVQKMVFLLYY